MIASRGGPIRHCKQVTRFSLSRRVSRDWFRDGHAPADVRGGGAGPRVPLTPRNNCHRALRQVGAPSEPRSPRKECPNSPNEARTRPQRDPGGYSRSGKTLSGAGCWRSMPCSASPMCGEHPRELDSPDLPGPLHLFQKLFPIAQVEDDLGRGGGVGVSRGNVDRRAQEPSRRAFAPPHRRISRRFLPRRVLPAQRNQRH